MRKSNKTKALQPVGVSEDDKNQLKKMVLSSTSQVSEKELDFLMKKFDKECSMSEEEKFKKAFDKMSQNKKLK